jgi:hypothetical protein
VCLRHSEHQRKKISSDAFKQEILIEFFFSSHILFIFHATIFFPLSLCDMHARVKSCSANEKKIVINGIMANEDEMQTI